MDIQDEGYTGSDTQSLPSFDEMMVAPEADEVNETTEKKAANLMKSVLSLPLEHRVQFVKDLCLTFPTAHLFEVHDTISGMVYFDPVVFLPPELILDVFSHLSPKDLLTASLVSRNWRQRTQDERLWHDCFGREGWILDRSRMTREEDWAKRRGARAAEGMMRNIRPGMGLQRRSSRKRPREEANLSENESTAVNIGEERVEELGDDAEKMQGLETTGCEGTSHGVEGNLTVTTATAKDALMEFDDSRPPTPELEHGPDDRMDGTEIQLQPPVFSAAKDPKISWPYLYKQRRRLERNWENGKYKMFQLPDPAHQAEGHKECVYTIQHSGKHLVSGSRDKTIRVWDLDTYRLKLPPLIGHEASVLCLQFDDRPGDGRDIIVSGGSDNFVIVWQFSTGKIIKKMTDAHTESVLNLRFDDRYLVTCSKDKSIRIWNRHEIAHDDPLIPRYVLNQFDTELNRGVMMKPFTLLATMTGHQAAVNAVQISGDVIVSASGDRTIKSWNLHSGSFKKSYQGHSKGIACVQFDGRRIVSGSSDNSVRIFDYETTAEVACLDGHNNLVRTVQARFGDLDTITDEELLEEAREADKAFLKALDAGMTPAQVSRHRRNRNPGSSKPEDMLSFGTKVPPGGGGSKWAKIVSGSYDETVIIWKRGKDGKWIPNLRLHQGMLLNQPGASNRVRPNALPQPANLNNIDAQGVQLPRQLNASQQAQQLLHQAQNQLLQVNSILQQPPLGQAHGLPTSQLTAITAAQNNLNSQMQVLASQQHQHAIQNGAATAPAANPATAGANVNAAASNAQPQAGTANHNANSNGPTAQPAQTGQAQAQGAQAQGHHHHHHHIHHHHHHPNPAANMNQRESNRVFKLQFDARRIVACSQNRVIVGWDFANGDKDLEWIGNWSVETA